METLYKVLIADDSPVNIKLLELILAKLGCAVTACANGREALDMASVQMFDHIILDIEMPVMNGLDAARQIKTTMNNNTPLMALSGSEAKEDRLAAIEAGFDEYLCKPVTPEQLRKKIQRGIRQSQAIKDALSGSDVLSLFDDDAGYRKTIDMFLATLPDTIAIMRHAFEHNDYDQLRKSVHSLKGTGGMAGFPVFTYLCTQIEQAIKDQKFAEIAAVLEKLAALVNKMVSCSCR
jgi:CheY-like chemotaxis protein